MFKDKVILITGGTGSWSYELTKQLLDKDPKMIILLSRGELAQVLTARAFNNDKRLKFVIGDVRDSEAVDRLFSTGIDYVYHCFPSKTKVICENEVKNIEDVKINDYVFSSNGQLNKVENLISRKIDEEMVDVVSYFSNIPITSTSDHTHLVWKPSKQCPKSYRTACSPACNNKLKGKCPEHYKKDRAEWIKAGDIQKGDYIAIPKVRINSENTEHSSAMMRLFGYYLAEGDLRKYAVRFTFSSKEDAYLTDVENILLENFGKKGSRYYTDHNSCTITVCGKDIVKKFEEFGKGAENKIVPSWVFKLKDVKKIEQLLLGYFCGDGCYSNGKMTTVSENLAYQLRLLFGMINISTGFMKLSKAKKDLIIDGKTVKKENFKQSYQISIGSSNKNKNFYVNNSTNSYKHFITDDYIFYLVKSVSKKRKKSVVYNLSVSGDHTYNVYGYATHNCAALKHVPVCENQPQEAIKTNINGTINIINSAIKHKIKKVIDVSSDKACLDYFQTITLADGTKRLIRDIVVNKEKVLVKSWDGKNFVNKKVTNWYKNKLASRQLYRIRYEGAPVFGKKQTSLIVTEDHPILTTTGWLPAMELNNGDMVYTDEVLYNKKERAFILGTVLGDAYITKRNKEYNRASLRISHCADQRELVELKHSILSETSENIHEYEHTKNGQYNRQNSVEFIVKSNIYISQLHSKCYDKDGVKFIPRQLVKQILHDEDTLGIFMAILFMDDGCNVNGLLRIATHGFTKQDVDWFATELTNLGFISYTFGCTVGYKVYPELRFRKEGSKKLTQLISKYIPESMRYKLPIKYISGEYDSNSWSMGTTTYSTAPITITLHNYKTSRDVYCIDVEDTHNFVARGIVVHNCSATNLYGMTKAVGEKLIIQANMLSNDTEFVCVRGGNVLGSNGSVVPLFVNQIRQFNRVTITDALMTRFFLTLPEAIALLFKAAECSVGGEMFVMNMPSFFIGDLAEVLIDHYGNKETSVDVIGLREGEKKHEVLISEHEVQRSYVFDEDYYIMLPELPIDRDYSSVKALPKVTFDSFSSSDNVKNKEYLTGLLDRGGFLL